VQTIVSPTLINEFRGGWLYTAQWFAQDGPTDYRTVPRINYNYGDYADTYSVGNSRYQPNISVSNTTTWTKGSHTVKFGGNWYREVNKYWDSEEGFTIIGLGLATGDPAADILTREAIRAVAGPGAPLPTDAEWNQARSLYAMLGGRISGITGRHPYVPSTGSYAVGNTPDPGGVAVNGLYELLTSSGVFVQDSWRLKPNLTANLGLRWDFVQPNKDQLGKYHSMRPQDVYGPTAVGQLFQPGAQSLTGSFDPVYVTRDAAHGSWNVTPQPAAGLAWTPRSEGSFIERMLGGDKSVLRGGYSFRRFTMPQQFIWDFGSSFGTAFFQNFSANPATTAGPGTFFPGSVVLGQTGYLPQSCARSSAPPCFTYAPAKSST
jgi:outer membrane receptor protein involved in Fe transport